MDRFYIDPGDVREVPGIAGNQPNGACSALDGVSINCTLGNGCQGDKLFREQETAAMYDEPLVIVWFFNFTNYL